MRAENGGSKEIKDKKGIWYMEKYNKVALKYINITQDQLP